MNELQLKLCDIQGRLFELSGAKGYASAPFIKAFMTGEVARGLDSKYNRLQWAGDEYLLAEVADTAGLTTGGIVYDKEVLYWAGYLYRFWHFHTGEDSKEIYKQATSKIMNRNWLIFHTFAPEVAIENLKEIYRQKGKCNIQDISDSFWKSITLKKSRFHDLCLGATCPRSADEDAPELAAA